MILPKFEDVLEAYDLIKPVINKTPIMKSEYINGLAGCEIYFKCENLQKVGAFKYRGASNAVLRLTQEQAAKGVATHSSGNHAQALALAAKKRGLNAYIVMPDNSPNVKKNAVAGYGAKIFFCEPNLKAREDTLAKVVEETGATVIHPYNNFNVIAGQGTACLELINEAPFLTSVIAPVGGGGLLSGTALAAKGLNPNIKVFAGEPLGADDAFKSLQKGEIVPSINPKTIADGLLTSLGEMNFLIISKNVDSIYTVTEEMIIKSMRLVWERMKLIIEPSSAVPLAAILSNPMVFKGEKIGLIISGGNADLDKTPW